MGIVEIDAFFSTWFLKTEYKTLFVATKFQWFEGSKISTNLVQKIF